MRTALGVEQAKVRWKSWSFVVAHGARAQRATIQHCTALYCSRQPDYFERPRQPSGVRAVSIPVAKTQHTSSARQQAWRAPAATRADRVVACVECTRTRRTCTVRWNGCRSTGRVTTILVCWRGRTGHVIYRDAVAAESKDFSRVLQFVVHASLLPVGRLMMTVQIGLKWHFSWLSIGGEWYILRDTTEVDDASAEENQQLMAWPRLTGTDWFRGTYVQRLSLSLYNLTLAYQRRDD